MDLPINPTESVKRRNPELYKPFRVAGSADDATDESKLHDQIMEFLKHIPVRAIIHSRMDRPTTQQVGLVDFHFVYNGVPVALEAKAAGRKLTPEQQGWLVALQLDGWVTGVVRSLADVAQVLEQARTRSFNDNAPSQVG